ncbi:uncharacterized protein LOC135141681 [Zophobas morio]
MFFNYAIIFACALLVTSKSLPDSNTDIISTYAKVAHWGAVSTSTTEKPESEARSHSGQSLWAHRSDVNIIGGQNLKTTRPKVVYQYAVQKFGQEKKDVVPGVGEVQERFNPRPYFDYTHVPSSKQAPKTETKTKTKSDSNPATFDSFPVFNPPSPPAPADLYSSQYSSYNPPSAGPVPSSDNSKPDVAYPPNAPPPADDNSDSDSGYQYNSPPQDAPAAPVGPPAPAYPTLGPPLAPNHHDHKEYYPPADDDDDKQPAFYPPSDSQDRPHPPSNGKDYGHYQDHGHKGQLYYPPSDDGTPHETILDHPPPGWQDSKQNMAPDMGAAPDAMDGNGMNGMNGMNGNGNGNGHDMAEHDLSPPPSSDFGGQFPHYLYNDPHGQGHDFDYDFDHHHVYKEITTTEAPEDERVNKGHYSYYYLGRKLWYIPLYFSVYFIIYVTVLILKSIARHKIQFKHQYLHKDMSKDMSKDMGHGRSFDLDELHENVTTAIDTSRRKFTYVAM